MRALRLHICEWVAVTATAALEKATRVADLLVKNARRKGRPSLLGLGHSMPQPTGKLQIRVVRARGLKDVGLLTIQDPFVQVLLSYSDGGDAHDVCQAQGSWCCVAGAGLRQSKVQGGLGRWDLPRLGRHNPDVSALPLSRDVPALAPCSTSATQAVTLSWTV